MESLAQEKDRLESDEARMFLAKKGPTLIGDWCGLFRANPKVSVPLVGGFDWWCGDLGIWGFGRFEPLEPPPEHLQTTNIQTNWKGSARRAIAWRSDMPEARASFFL